MFDTGQLQAPCTDNKQYLQNQVKTSKLVLDRPTPILEVNKDFGIKIII